MTLTQAARSVIAQWWIVVLTAALAATVAGAVQTQREPEFASTTVLRLSAQMTTAAAEGVLEGVAVDVDPSIITAPAVLAPAAAAVGVEVGTVAGRVQVTSDAPNVSGRTSQVEVTTTADTPGGARDLASAVASAYQDYLVSQVDSARTALEARRASAQSDASQYQQALRVDPEDPIATAGLTAALAALSTTSTQLSELANSGPPATVIAPASPGAPTTPSLLTVVLVAVAAGGIAGVAIALARTALDVRLRREDDVAEITGTPSLGVLSYDRASARRRGTLGVGAVNDALAEDIRALRRTLQVLLPGTGAVVVITSVFSG